MAKSSTTWQPGQSGNPNGRPKDGDSWSACLRELASKSPEELIEMVGGPNSPYGKRMKELPRKVQMKIVANLNALITLSTKTTGRYDKPFNATLYGEVMNRVEGRVPEKMIAGIANIPLEMFEEVLDEVYNKK